LERVYVSVMRIVDGTELCRPELCGRLSEEVPEFAQLSVDVPRLPLDVVSHHAAVRCRYRDQEANVNHPLRLAPALIHAISTPTVVELKQVLRFANRSR
jgi:hypothetical protein